MSAMYLTPASLSKMLFNVGPLCTGLISTLLSLARSRAQPYITLSFGNKYKAISPSDVSSTSKAIIICCFCNLSKSSLRDSWSKYGTLLGATWYGQLPSFTCKLNVPSKYYIPDKTH